MKPVCVFHISIKLHYDFLSLGVRLSLLCTLFFRLLYLTFVTLAAPHYHIVVPVLILCSLAKKRLHNVTLKNVRQRPLLWQYAHP